MGKVYIRNFNMIDNINLYIAYIGFKQLGYEIGVYNNVGSIKENSIEDVIVGGIGDVRKVLDSFNIKYPTLEYPTSLRKFLGRDLRVSTLGDIVNNPNNWGIFIKPVVGGKLFTGKVISELSDLRACAGIDPSVEVWCSDVVNFISEYRCFIRYGEVVGVKHYKGDWSKAIDKDVLQRAIAEYDDAPNAYTLDFGVTNKGETLLIEVNEGYSVGCYGLDGLTYAKFLITRWAELTNTVDEYKF